MSTSESSVASRLSSIASHLKPSKPRVVVCRDLGPDVMPLLTDRTDIELVIWPQNSVCERKWLLDNIRGASGVVLMLSEKVNAELLDAAGPSLRVVSTMSVGYEHVDLSLLASRGVKLGYTPNVLTDAVADISVMLALMAGRNARSTLEIVTGGEWPGYHWSPFAFCGPQIGSTATNPSRTAGFLGFGRISQATLSRLIPFGVTHAIYTANPRSDPAKYTSRDAAILEEHSPKLQGLKAVDMDTLARESDVLFVLAPGGEETRHVVNEQFLMKMKKHSVLVNTARGTLVDSDALAKALKEQWIWGAGLDVVEGEPNVGLDHPLVKEPRCVVVPHIGSATFETRIAMATRAVNNCLGGVFGTAMPAELDTSSYVP